MRKLADLDNPEEKQHEMQKGLEVLELCEIILTDKAAHELLDLLKKQLEKKDLREFET